MRALADSSHQAGGQILADRRWTRANQPAPERENGDRHLKRTKNAHRGRQKTIANDARLIAKLRRQARATRPKKIFKTLVVDFCARCRIGALRHLDVLTFGRARIRLHRNITRRYKAPLRGAAADAEAKKRARRCCSRDALDHDDQRAARQTERATLLRLPIDGRVDRARARASRARRCRRRSPNSRSRRRWAQARARARRRCFEAASEGRRSAIAYRMQAAIRLTASIDRPANATSQQLDDSQNAETR